MNVQAEDRTILFLGDSLTDGYTLGKEFAYPALIQKKLVKHGSNLRVVNAGVSGDTIQDGLERLPRYLDQDISIFVAALGANDLFREVPLKKMETGLNEILILVLKRHPEAQLVVIGMKDFIRKNNQKESQAIEAIFSNSAKEFRAIYIPFLLEGVANIADLLLPGDRIHPNEKGQEKMAALVWARLLPIINIDTF